MLISTVTATFDVLVGNYFADGAHILDANAGGVEAMHEGFSKSLSGGNRDGRRGVGEGSLGMRPTPQLPRRDPLLVGICLFGLAAAPRWWTLAGAVLITALFVFVSVPWMDRHMLARHPAYGGRLRTTFALLPWPARRRA